MSLYNWGILGPGSIANKTIKSFACSERANVLAVGSRTPGKAKAFAEKWDIPRYYENYEELVDDKDLDIIYITTPNGLHHENALLAMRHGKHVLVEKPFAMNAALAREMVQCARENHVLLMDAMWSRFFPSMKKLKELLTSGVIGAVHNLYADFSYDYPYRPGHHLYNLKMGGGALIDGGIYPLALAVMVYGQMPQEVVGLANKAHDVDVRANVIMKFKNGGMASFFCGSDTTSFWGSVIYGEKGYILVPHYHAASRIEVKRYNSEETQVFKFPFSGEGYQYQFNEVMDCISRGLGESPGMPLDETVGMLEVIDRLRHQWGIVYPGE